MDPNVLLALKLLEIVQSAAAGLKSIQQHDPEAYAKAAAHHAAAGAILDGAQVPE